MLQRNKIFFLAILLSVQFIQSMSLRLMPQWKLKAASFMFRWYCSNSDNSKLMALYLKKDGSALIFKWRVHLLAFAMIAIWQRIEKTLPKPIYSGLYSIFSQKCAFHYKNQTELLHIKRYDFLIINSKSTVQLKMSIHFRFIDRAAAVMNT